VRCLVTAGGTVIALASLLISSYTSAAPERLSDANAQIGLVNETKLRKHDRVRLAEARVQNKAFVTLLLAVRPGFEASAADQIATEGGRIQFRDDETGYIRVKVATESVEKIAQWPAIESLNIDG
jgi:hypothetical protein